MSMTMEQSDWLERKGVADPGSYEYIGQDDRRVYFLRRDIGLKINRKKDIVGMVF